MKVRYIDTDTEKGLAAYQEHMKVGSELFRAVESRFDDWIEGRTDYEEMYFGEDAIYTKTGAIRQGIESIFEAMTEDNLKFIDLKNFDLEASFE